MEDEDQGSETFCHDGPELTTWPPAVGHNSLHPGGPHSLCLPSPLIPRPLCGEGKCRHERASGKAVEVQESEVQVAGQEI